MTFTKKLIPKMKQHIYNAVYPDIIMDSESFHLDCEVDIFFRHKWVGKMEINMYIYIHIYSVLSNILFISYIIISFTNISVCK